MITLIRDPQAAAIEDAVQVKDDKVGQTILECWIPAEDLGALNASPVGKIEVTAELR